MEQKKNVPAVGQRRIFPGLFETGYPATPRFGRLFDDFFAGWPTGAFSKATELEGQPRVDVSETAEEIVVEAELPGVEEKDIDVSLEDNVLTLRGEKRSERTEGQDYRYTERSFGSFERSMTLPVEVESEQVAATFANGLLTVRLPKSSKVQKRRISIKTQ